MKKSNIKVNVMEQTISVSKAFYKKACVYGTTEYKQLTDAQRNNPTFDVKFKEYDKKTYNGLTIAKMREYILTQDNSEDRLIEFEAVVTTAKAKGAQYPLTKKWFLAAYVMEHANREHGVSIGEIRDCLLNEGNVISIDERTIYKDLAVLRDRMGLDLEYRKKYGGWILKNPLFEPYELQYVVDSVQASKFITQQKAREITEKIKKLTDVHTRKTLNRRAYVLNRVRSMNESVVKEAYKIHDALEADCKVSFQYFHYSPNKDNPKSYFKAGERYVVSPFALLWDNGNYYLYAYTDKKQFRTFRVDRMERISVLAAMRDGKEHYKSRDVYKQTAHVFEMYHGTEYRVHIRFHNRVAHAVIDKFGKDTMMLPYDDTHFTITVPVEISPPFFAWIASLGHSAKILSPSPVVQEMKKFIARVQDMYKDEGEM